MMCHEWGGIELRCKARTELESVFFSFKGSLNPPKEDSAQITSLIEPNQADLFFARI